MRTNGNKYQDRNQNEVIFFTSTTHFSTYFLQKKRLSESSEFRSNHNVSPNNYSFSFTGKEKDAETGYGYFGARYMDHELMTMWLSVDPMADKYPSMSPYAYCAWNPVKLVDPDGREIDEWNLNKTTGELVWVSNRGHDSGTDYINIVDSYGGYYGSYVGSRSDNYHFSYSTGIDNNGNPFFNIETQNMDFSLFHPGMGNLSVPEVFPSTPLSNSEQLDLWGIAKNAAFAIDAFTAPQNALIENIAANNSKNISKSLGKSVGRYNTGIKCLGYAGTFTTIGASVMQGYDYYSNGGTNWLVGAKLALDVGMAVVSNFGPIGMAIGFSYSFLDVCTSGFGTNNELNKIIK